MLPGEQQCSDAACQPLRLSCEGGTTSAVGMAGEAAGSRHGSVEGRGINAAAFSNWIQGGVPSVPRLLSDCRIRESQNGLGWVGRM